MVKNIHEQPIPPTELLIYEILHKRKTLSKTEQKNFINLKNGHEGEVEFFEFLNLLLPPGRLLLHSLQLSHNNSEFQIDSLLIWQNTIYLFDVKNFVGDFYVQGKNWYVSPSGKEINNPLIQLSRAESLLRQLVNRLGFNFDIQSNLVFVNPEFALFQAPIQFPIILRAQFNRFFKKIIGVPATPANKAVQLAQTLTDHHLEKSSYERLPEYTFEELKKGVFCPECSRKMSRYNRRSIICQSCGSKETNETAIINCVNEFQMLFSQKYITCRQISDWTGDTFSQKTIRNCLSRHLDIVKKGKEFSFKSTTIFI